MNADLQLVPQLVNTRERADLPKNLVLYCGRHDFGTRVLKKRGT
jgi:hypothetical protein